MWVLQRESHARRRGRLMAGVGGARTRSRAMSERIAPNSRGGMATSAGWNETQRPWRTTLAPILASLVRRVVGDRCATSSGEARVRGKLVRFYASACGCNRAVLPFTQDPGPGGPRRRA